MEYQQTAVANHLRICADRTEDGTWLDTLYPSEPLLSCAAAELLHKRRDNLIYSLKCLRNEIANGVIDTGKRGELVSRLILLFAKDLCVRQSGFLQPKLKYGRRANELLDCRPLSVVQYLEFLFGDGRLTDSMKEPFYNWYIDFSHWIPMRKPIQAGSEGQLGYVFYYFLRAFNLMSDSLQIA